MRYFELSQEGLKRKIRGGEKVAGYSILLFGVAFVFFLSVNDVLINWRIFLLIAAACWLLVEITAYAARQRRYQNWVSYRIGYENDLLIEERGKQQEAAVLRHQIRAIEETRFGLLVTSSVDSIMIPYELEDYEDLLVRLRNWDSIEKRTDRWRRTLNRYRDHLNRNDKKEKKPRPPYRNQRLGSSQRSRGKAKANSFISQGLERFKDIYLAQIIGFWWFKFFVIYFFYVLVAGILLSITVQDREEISIILFLFLGLPIISLVKELRDLIIRYGSVGEQIMFGVVIIFPVLCLIYMYAP